MNPHIGDSEAHLVWPSRSKTGDQSEKGLPIPQMGNPLNQHKPELDPACSVEPTTYVTRSTPFSAILGRRRVTRPLGQSNLSSVKKPRTIHGKMTSASQNVGVSAPNGRSGASAPCVIDGCRKDERRHLVAKAGDLRRVCRRCAQEMIAALGWVLMAVIEDNPTVSHEERPPSAGVGRHRRR